MQARGTQNRRPLWPAIAAAIAVLAAFVVVFGNTGGLTPTTTAAPIHGLATPVASTAPPAQPAPPAGVSGWTRLPAGPLSSRTNHAAVWTGEAMVVLGGRTLLDVAPGAAAYRPASNEWATVPDAPGLTRAQPVAVWTGRALVSFGAAATALDLGGDTWDPPSLPPIAPTYPLAAVWTGEEVIAVGYDVHPPTRERNTSVVALDPLVGCCRSLADPPLDFTYAEAVWTGEHVLVIGGFGGPRAGNATPRFARYSPDSDAWTELEPPPLKGGGRMTAAWTGSELVVVDYLMRTASWQPDRGWRRLGNAPFDYRECLPRTVVVGDIVFAWYCRQAALLDPGGESWTRIDVPELDDHAVSTSCLPVTAGDRVLMWCGNDPAEPFFWQIDPASVAPLPADSD